MKKIISLLSAIALTATSGSAIISCQAKETEDPLYKLPKMPENLDEVIELMGYYWDLYEFYNAEYFNKEAPKGIHGIDSENYQKNAIFLFFSGDCLNYIGYQLGQRGGFDFQTPQGYRCDTLQTDKEGLKRAHECELNDDTLSIKTKKQATKWYNWALSKEAVNDK